MPTLNNYVLLRTRGESTYIPTAPTYIDNEYLVGGSGIVYPVPNNARICKFSVSTGEFFARVNAAPPYHTGTMTASGYDGASATVGAGGEISPTVWELTNVTGIGLLAETNTRVSMSFFS